MDFSRAATEVYRHDLSPLVVRVDNRGKRPMSQIKSVSEVVTMVENGVVMNPMFQRIEGWTVFKDKKKKHSNYYEYIEFLYETCHSFGAFTWAKYTTTDVSGGSGGGGGSGGSSEYFLNIDGNNRICAILYFYKHPLRLYSQPLLLGPSGGGGAGAGGADVEEGGSDDDDDEAEEEEEEAASAAAVPSRYHNFGRFRQNPEKFKDMIEFLESLDLRQLMHFNMKALKKDSRYGALYKSLTDDEQEYFEEEMERTKLNLQTRDRSGNPSNFYDEVVISINVLDKPDKAYLADIYQKINGKHNPMSASDIAAAMMITANKFVLSDAVDPVLETQLRVKLDEYYDHRFKDARVVRLKETTASGGASAAAAAGLRPLNGYEFLVALQEHCCDRFHLVPRFGDELQASKTGYGFMLKLFDLLHGLTPDHFTTATVRSFATTVMNALVVLHAVYDDVFPATIKIERARKTYSKTDALFRLVLVISKFNEMVAAGTMEAKKRNLIVRKVMVYHFFCLPRTSLLSKEIFALYRVPDELQYYGGGETAKIKARGWLVKPETFGKEIKMEKMKELFRFTVEAYNEKAAAAAAASGKRQKLPDEILLILSIYYHSRVPFHKYGKDKRNNDHIFPASCSAAVAESVTLSRVGNYMIISEALNKGRQNRSIQYYYEKDPDLMRCLDYPSMEQYDQVVEYPSSKVVGGGGKPVLRNVREFNRLAEKLEAVYVNLAIKYVFDIV